VLLLSQSVRNFYTASPSNQRYCKILWSAARQKGRSGTEKSHSWCWNELTDDAETTLSGSAFQILAVTTGKARLPIVDSLKDSIPRWNYINFICVSVFMWLIIIYFRLIG